MSQTNTLTEFQLRELLAQPKEGLKLDFKREYKLNKTPPTSDTDKRLWNRFVEGQWHEFIKDILVSRLSLDIPSSDSAG
jgi:hypothetical protein